MEQYTRTQQCVQTIIIRKGDIYIKYYYIRRGMNVHTVIDGAVMVCMRKIWERVPVMRARAESVRRR